VDRRGSQDCGEVTPNHIQEPPTSYEPSAVPVWEFSFVEGAVVIEGAPLTHVRSAPG